MNKEKEGQNFGEHIMIDGYRADQEKLNDEKLVFDFLDKLPNLIGMKKSAIPHIYFSDGNDLKDPGGWSGYVFIEGSHISIHTFSKRGFVTVDIYSSGTVGIDRDLILDYTTRTFDIKEIEQRFMRRGDKII